MKVLPSHLAHLQAQAVLLEKIRTFFKTKNILEVQTPLLYPTPVTDPYIQAFEVPYQNKKFYLQTSPEYAMKRLLAAGSGPIYQICKAFRDEDHGRFHNPEFTMLEWYRPGFTESDLIQEVDELLQLTLQTPPLNIMSYRECFEKFLRFNPHQVSLADLKQCCEQQDLIVLSSTELSKDDYLSLLFSHSIEKFIGQDRPVAVNYFPATQAALAKQVEINGDRVACRFEIYYQGLELANAYDEETSSAALSQQFEIDLLNRKNLKLKPVPIDPELLNITDELPAGCGIALGLDRLMLLALKATALSELNPFHFSRL